MLALALELIKKMVIKTFSFLAKTNFYIWILFLAKVNGILDFFEYLHRTGRVLKKEENESKPDNCY